MESTNFLEYMISVWGMGIKYGISNLEYYTYAISLLKRKSRSFVERGSGKEAPLGA